MSFAAMQSLSSQRQINQRHRKPPRKVFAGSATVLVDDVPRDRSSLPPVSGGGGGGGQRRSSGRSGPSSDFASRVRSPQYLRCARVLNRPLKQRALRGQTLKPPPPLRFARATTCITGGRRRARAAAAVAEAVAAPGGGLRRVGGRPASGCRHLQISVGGDPAGGGLAGDGPVGGGPAAAVAGGLDRR